MSFFVTLINLQMTLYAEPPLYCSSYYYYSAGVNKFGGWKVPWALSCSPYSTHYFYLKLSFVWVKSNSLATNSWLQSTVYARLTSNNSGFMIFERMAKHPKFLNTQYMTTWAKYCDHFPKFRALEILKWLDARHFYFGFLNIHYCFR